MKVFAKRGDKAMNILSYKGYKGLFGYDPEREVFHGDVINLTDVITFQGCSIDELKQSLVDSLDDYLSFCKESGKTPDKPYSGRFNIRIDPDLHRQLVSDKNGNRNHNNRINNRPSP
jgi:predicted HicB family RNase H-like nuclease